MSDDRFTPEQRELDEAARRKPIPARADPPTVPCRKYVDDAVTPEMVEEFLKELEKE